MKKILILCAMFLFSEGAVAHKLLDETEIKNIRVRPTLTYVLFEGCHHYSKIYLRNDYDKSMLSVALTAAAANKKVAVQFLDGKSCSQVETEINFIDVKFK
ncbi:hypothetical protein [Pseudoalteromonas piscicida]|uniref:hypothetical protein n=1 Tax=Pseudoalteromonas piscicida TaxID=43662 RepID=UPI0030ABCEA3